MNIDSLKTFLLKNLLTLIGAGLGAIVGYIYYAQIGCESGSCGITSSPVNSTLYGSLMGALFLNLFQKQKK